MATISITIDGVERFHDVIFAQASFQASAQGTPGQCSFAIRDDRSPGYQPGDLHTGQEIVLTVDGQRVWGGFVMSVTPSYFFPVQDTTGFNPGTIERQWLIQGADYNILFVKRFVYDQDDPVKEIPNYPKGTHDDVVIADIIENFLDLSGDGIDTSSGVVHVGTPGQLEDFRMAAIGEPWGTIMTRCALNVGAVFYIDPDKVLRYNDDETVNAPHPISDRPASTPGAIGYRDMGIKSDAMELANDAMIWGAGLGSPKMVQSRNEDAASIALHGRFQYAELRTDQFLQDSVDLRSDTYINGSPQHHRGHKDPRQEINVTLFEPGYRCAQVVEFHSEIFGFQDDVPVREVRITFPTQTSARFELRLSHDIDPGLAVADYPWDLTYSEWIPIDYEPWQPPERATDTSDPSTGDIFPLPRTSVIVSTAAPSGTYLPYYPPYPATGTTASTLGNKWVEDATWLNIPWPASGCGIGPGGFAGHIYSEVWMGLPAFYTWDQFMAQLGGRDVQFGIGVSDRGFTEDTGLIAGVARQLEVWVAHLVDGTDPTRNPLPTDIGQGAFLGVVDLHFDHPQLDFGMGTWGGVNFTIPNEYFAMNSLATTWVILRPAWEATSNFVCDISYTGGSPAHWGPAYTGQNNSGVFAANNIQVRAIGYPYDPTTGNGGDYPGADEIPSDYEYGAFWQCKYAYVPGSLEVEIDGMPLRKGQDFFETSPSEGRFQINIPVDLKTTDGIRVKYRIAGSSTSENWPALPPPYWGGGSGDDGQEHDPPDDPGGNTGGRVYRPRFVSQLGWGNRLDGSNCVAAAGCVGLDRHTLGSKRDTPPGLRSGQSDQTEGLRLDQIQDALENRWGEHFFLAGVISYESFRNYVNSGRGAMLVGDSHAFIPYNLEARSEYDASWVFVGKHGIYINEQRDNGDYYVYDPAFRKNSRYHISPGWYPASAIRAYAAGSTGSHDRVYCLFTDRTGKQ